MEQSPSWEANNHSARQKITHLLWNLEVHSHVQKSLSLVPVLSQMNLVYTFPPCFSKIHSGIIIPSFPRSSKWSRPFGFSNQSFVLISYISHVCYMAPHLTHLDLITLIIFSEEYKLWSSSLCIFLHFLTNSYFLHSNILLSTLSSSTYNLVLSWMWDQISHTYKTKVKL